MKAVILAGGGGTRLWPLSTLEKPKQFQKLVSDKTMLEETVDRLDFDGTDDWIQYKNLGDYDTTNYTIMCWIKGTDANGGGVYMYMNASGYYQWGLYVHSDGKLWAFHTPTNTSIQYLKSTSNVNDGNWHHIATTYDETSEDWKIYIDGQENNSTNGFKRSRTGSMQLRIGRSGANVDWDGRIADTKQWRLGLTATQITNVYDYELTNGVYSP